MQRYQPPPTMHVNGSNSAIRFKGRLTQLLLLNGRLYLCSVCLDQDVDLRTDTKKSYMFGRDQTVYSKFVTYSMV